MKYGRFSRTESENSFYGIVEDDQVLPLKDDGSPDQTHPLALSSLKILVPVQPSKILAAGLNYSDHAAEMKLAVPSESLIFLKSVSSLLPHQGTIVCPVQSSQVEYEAELAVVISRPCKDVSPHEAHHYIFGYTAANDVTARDLQKKDGQWARAKSFDTFAPLGPFINTSVKDPENLKIEARLNGKTVQSSGTSNMIFPVYQLVSYISHCMSLLPGDVILTGTPAGIGIIKPGDTIEIVIEGLDILSNTVTA